MTDGKSTSYPTPAEGWYAVGVLVLATLFAYLDRQTLALMVGPIRQELAISDTQVSLLQGLAFTGVYALAGIPLGRLVDRRRRTTLIAVAVAFWSIMTMACGLATSFMELFLARAGVGLGEAALMPATYSLIADCFEPKRRGRALGVLGVGLSVGAGAGLLVGGVLLNLIRNTAVVDIPLMGPVTSWHIVFFVSGAPGLLVALLVLTLREPARQERSKGAATANVQFLVDYVRQNATAYGSLFAAALCTITASGGLGAWMATLLIRNLHIPSGSAGLMLGASLTFFGTVSALIVGPATDRWIRQGKAGGRLRGLLFTVPSCTLGTALAVTSSNIHVAVLGYGLAIGSGVASTVISYSSTQDISPNQIRGQMSAICSVTLNFIGVSAGPTLVALATDYIFRDDQSLPYSLLLVCMPLQALSLVITLIGLKPYSRTRAALEANMATTPSQAA